MLMRNLGEPSDLELTTLDDPEPGVGAVSIDVKAIGCNFADVLICQGKYQVSPQLPFAPGSEVAGTVRALGPGVATTSELRVGERVTAQLTYGAYATVVCADAKRVQRIPDGVEFDAACALGVAYQTAYLSLVDRAQLRAGETLLVQAAAGGVGLATVQLGHALGARVIAGASENKLALCREHGADAAIDTNVETWPEQIKELTHGRGADVISESVGGSVFDGSLKCIAWGGRLIVVGFSSGQIPTPRMNRVLLKHIALLGLNLHSYQEHNPKALQDAASALFELHRARKLMPLISGRYPLEDAKSALRELAARRSVGKLLLVP
jgi:NADPH2:quinone reductase